MRTCRIDEDRRTRARESAGGLLETVRLAAVHERSGDIADAWEHLAVSAAPFAAELAARHPRTILQRIDHTPTDLQLKILRAFASSDELHLPVALAAGRHAYNPASIARMVLEDRVIRLHGWELPLLSGYGSIPADSPRTKGGRRRAFDFLDRAAAAGDLALVPWVVPLLRLRRIRSHAQEVFSALTGLEPPLDEEALLRLRGSGPSS